MLAAGLCAGAVAQPSFPRGAPMGGGRPGGFERGGPPRGGGFEARGRMPERREPGSGVFGPPPEPYQPPHYPAPLQRRPDGAEPGWRGGHRLPVGAPLRDMPSSGSLASLGWVIESLGRRAPGRVLDAELADEGGRPVYHVLWLTQHGRRMAFVVDAATGAVVSGR
jgi:hypothetical protein